MAVGVSVDGKDVVGSMGVAVCDGVPISDRSLLGVGWPATVHAEITIVNRNVEINAMIRPDMGYPSFVFRLLIGKKFINMKFRVQTDWRSKLIKEQARAKTHR